MNVSWALVGKGNSFFIYRVEILSARTSLLIIVYIRSYYHCLFIIVYPLDLSWTERGELKSPTNLWFSNLCYMMVIFTFLVYRFSNYCIFSAYLPYLIQCGIFDVQKLLRFYAVKFYQYYPFLIFVFCVMLKRSISTPNFLNYSVLLWFCYFI